MTVLGIPTYRKIENSRNTGQFAVWCEISVLRYCGGLSVSGGESFGAESFHI
jgi:hypothetical protein